MPGPNSSPNGDTTIVRGHADEVFVCERHKDKELDACAVRKGCEILPLRTYLAKRNRLITGKTR